MKKTTVQFSFEDEKLQAVSLYMKQKNADLDGEMDEFLDKIYKQYVPANVRQFIDLKKVEKEQPKPQKPQQQSKQNTEDKL